MAPSGADGEAPSAAAAGEESKENTCRFYLRGIEALGEHHLKEYFERFGDVCEVDIVRDKKTKRPRGMGFVTIGPRARTALDDDNHNALHALIEKLTEDSHTINGVEVELQEALPPKKNEGEAEPAAE